MSQLNMFRSKVCLNYQINSFSVFIISSILDLIISSIENLDYIVLSNSLLDYPQELYKWDSKGKSY